MKFLADESVEYRFIGELRKLNYDLISISEDFSGITDKEVLELAFNQNRVLITNDKDFGELVFRLKFPNKGVILFRLFEETYLSKLSKFKLVVNRFKSRLLNSFIVITDKKIRIRKSERANK